MEGVELLQLCIGNSGTLGSCWLYLMLLTPSFLDPLEIDSQDVYSPS